MSTAKGEILRVQENLNDLNLGYRTKLNPKKKAKDSQNFKPNHELNLSELRALFEQDQPDIVKKMKTMNGKSKSATGVFNDGIFLSAFKSSSQMNLTSNRNGEKILPRKMWWVPPLRKPSNYVAPSIPVSLASYSNASSMSQPRVSRSADDLRKKVIAQCNQLEAVGLDKLDKQVDKLHNEFLNAVKLSSTHIPSSKRAHSKESNTEGIGNSAESSKFSDKAKTSLNLTDFEDVLASDVAKEREISSYKSKKSSFREKELPAKDFQSSQPGNAFSSNISQQKQEEDALDSNASSISRPRVSRSADDLRKKVIAQCNQLESVGFDKLCKSVDKLENESLNAVQKSPTHIPSTPTEELNIEEIGNSPKSSKFSDKAKDSLELEISTPTSPFREHELPAKNFRSSQPGNSFLSKIGQQKEEEDSLGRNYTIGDIARKHIVQPISVKLAILCTKQGQMYLDLITDLEKSCAAFEKACEQKALRK